MLADDGFRRCINEAFSCDSQFGAIRRSSEIENPGLAIHNHPLFIAAMLEGSSKQVGKMPLQHRIRGLRPFLCRKAIGITFAKIAESFRYWIEK